MILLYLVRNSLCISRQLHLKDKPLNPLLGGKITLLDVTVFFNTMKGMEVGCKKGRGWKGKGEQWEEMTTK